MKTMDNTNTNVNNANTNVSIAEKINAFYDHGMKECMEKYAPKKIEAAKKLENATEIPSDELKMLRHIADKNDAWGDETREMLKNEGIIDHVHTIETIKYMTFHLENVTNYPEYKEIIKEYFAKILDNVVEKAIKAKIEADEKILEKERVKAEREAEKAAAKLAKENAKKEREEKRAAEKAEKEKIKAEKAKLKAEKAAEKENEKAAKRLAKSNIPMITALLKTNAAKIEKPVVTTETSENA